MSAFSKSGSTNLHKLAPQDVDFERKVYCLLGLPFDTIKLGEAVTRVQFAAARRQRCFLSTPNLSFLIGCLRDTNFRNSVINSDLSVADGMPLVWIARLLGIPIAERVAGSEIFEVLRHETGQCLSVYFFGGPDGAAATASLKLNAEAAGLLCRGYESPGFGSVEAMSSDETLLRINASGADFLVVALGAKKGQAWIEHNLSRLEVPVVSHLGAVVNFVAGSIKRAPRWMQRGGLEWLWRIKEEPTLWRRYWQDGWALLHLLTTRILPYAWHRRQHAPSPDELASARSLVHIENGILEIRLEGAWSDANLQQLRPIFARAVLRERDIRLNLAAVLSVDSAFVGLLMLLYGHQRRHARALLVKAVPFEVRRVFNYLCADFMLD